MAGLARFLQQLQNDPVFGNVADNPEMDCADPEPQLPQLVVDVRLPEVSRPAPLLPQHAVHQPNVRLQPPPRQQAPEVADHALRAATPKATPPWKLPSDRGQHDAPAAGGSSSSQSDSRNQFSDLPANVHDAPQDHDSAWSGWQYHDSGGWQHHDQQPHDADIPAFVKELREEQDAATALSIRWQDRGPVPDDPHNETWRGQRWRARASSTEDASAGRWGNRGGKHRTWYSTFYALKGSKGHRAASEAADEAIGKGQGKSKGQR